MVLEARELWMEFMAGDREVCGLCGNCGVIPAGEVTTAAGISFHRAQHFCICPNGRAIKEGSGRNSPTITNPYQRYGWGG